MKKELYHVRLADLDRNVPEKGTTGRDVSEACLHYSAPSAGGWGIVRTALLVPESVMLFVAPHGCGRHGSVSSIQLGIRDRIYYMDISEEDLVLGSHVQRIEEAVEHILSSRKRRPPAFFICASCIDDLLATDYKNITKRMTEKHGLPFVDAHMNPITANSSMPPPQNIQRSIYNFLSMGADIRTPKNTLNIVGHFTKVNADSEFYTLMKQSGFDKVLQVTDSDSFSDFMEMRHSSHNLLIKPFGRAACRNMEQYLGIPYHEQFVRYGIEEIRRGYDEFSAFLGRDIPYIPYYEACRQELDLHRQKLKGLRIGVGSGANGSPFEIALALVEAGAEIAFITSLAIMDYEWEYINKLMQINKNIPVYTSYHPSMAMINEIPEKSDVAIGFDASYMCPSAKLLPLDADNQHYGFEAAMALVRGVEEALISNVSARELLYSKGLVV